MSRIELALDPERSPPRRRRPARSLRQRRGVQQQRKGAGWTWVIVFGALLAILILSDIATSKADDWSLAAPAPGEILGRWTTTDPSFANRYLEITPHTVTFHDGGRSSPRLPILRVDRKTSADGFAAQYLVHFENLDLERETLLITMLSGGRIVVGNRRGVAWSREESGSGI